MWSPEAVAAILIALIVRRPLVGVFLACLLAWALPARAQRLSIRQFGIDDGLPSVDVGCVVPDSRGFVWFCTGDGLTRFDGASFRTYATADGLPDRHVTALLEDGDGSYWVGTQEGLAHFDPQARVHRPAAPLFTPVRGSQPGAMPAQLNRTPFPVSMQAVHTLYRDRSGVVWGGSDTGVFRVVRDAAGPRMEPADLQIRQPAAVHAILVDRQNRLWIGAESGLYRRDADGRMVDFGTEGLLDRGTNHNRVDALMQSRDGWIWAGGDNLGLRLVAPDAAPGPRAVTHSWSDDTGILRDRVMQIIETRDGDIWWVGLHGVRSLRKGRSPAWDDAAVHVFGVANGLPGPQFDVIAEGLSGDLWLAGDPVGIVRVTRHGFTTFTESDGLDTRAVHAITADRDGAIVAVTERARGSWFHNRFNGRTFEPVRFNIPHEDWGWGWGQLSFQDRSGRWWLPTGQAVYRSAPDVEFTRLNSAPFFKFPSPFPPQPFLRAGELVTDFSDNPPELQAWAAFRLFPDSHGYVWAGTMQRMGGHDTPNELARWDPRTDRFALFPNSDQYFVPMSFAEDRAGDVWIGGYNGGLRRVAQGASVLEDESALLATRGAIPSLLGDSRGQVWVGTADQGVIRIDRHDGHPVVGRRYGLADGLASLNVQALVEDAYGRVYVGHSRGVDVIGKDGTVERNYSIADGLARGAVWCAYRDATGALWFGTMAGLSRLVPEPGPMPSPRLLITGLTVGGQVHPISEVGEQSVAPFDVPNETPDIRIDYAALGGGSPTELRYQVMLDGVDQGWGAPSRLQSSTFRRLAAGRYRFLVRAVSPGGVALSNAGEVPFRVLPPLWARPWSIASLILMVTGVLYALHRVRLARAIEVERLRLRLARDLHDDLGASLSRLAIIGDAAQRDPSRAVPALADVSATARRLMVALGEIVWFADPGKDTALSVLDRVAAHGQELFEPQGVAWSCDVAPEIQALRLSGDVRRDLYLMLKEAVTNAAKHARCTRASLTAAATPDTLRIVVSDDGCGFDATLASGGNGLGNMAARAEAIGARLTVTSKQGDTQVRIEVPLRSAR